MPPVQDILDYGAVIAAGIAAVASLANLFVTWRAKRSEWTRTERIDRYCELVSAATTYEKAVLKAGMTPSPDHALANELQHAEATFEEALAGVLIVGPREVSRRASIVHSSHPRTAPGDQQDS